MSTAVENLQKIISHHITEIRRLFKSPVQVTIIVRDPDDPNGGCMVGNDDAEDVIAEIRRRTDPSLDNEILPAGEHPW